MTGMVVLAIDRDVAGHLAVALRRHRDALHKNRLAEPEGLAQLEKIALQVVSSDQQASEGVTVPIGPQDGSHERDYLSRADIRQLTGASLSTIDRWIRSGNLPSRRHGRTRRVARTDLDQFLAA